MAVTRRGVLAVAAAAPLLLPAGAAVAATDYGSGAWGGLGRGRAISADTQFAKVRDRNGVVMFGDSISMITGRDLAVRLYAADQSLMAVHNRSGAPTWYGIDALQSVADRIGLPRRVLLALGTNDIFEPVSMSVQIDRAMAIVGADRVVVWVNVYVARRGSPVADVRNSGMVNLAVAAATARHPNLVVVDWFGFLGRKPSYRLPAYLPDGVHPDADGTAALNALIVPTLVTA